MVEGTGFENRHTGNCIGSSNLPLSAMKILAIETSCDDPKQYNLASSVDYGARCGDITFGVLKYLQ